MNSHKSDMFRSTGMPKNLSGSKIAKLQDQSNMYLNLIRQEQEKLKLLNIDIEGAELQLKQRREELLRAKKDSRGNKGMNEGTLGKNIKILQVKIDQKNAKYNEILARNKQLQNQINFLRREKMIFSNIQENLSEDLGTHKGKLKEIIKESDDAFKFISKAKTNLREAKVQKIENQKRFDKEFQSIYQMLNEENRDEKLRENKKRAQEEDIDEIDFEGEKEVKGEKKRGYMNAKEMEQTLEEAKGEVRRYEEIFNKLKEETGKENITEIIKTFVAYENSNYSLLNFINTQSDEVNNNFCKLLGQLEGLVKQKKAMEEEIEEIQRPLFCSSDPKFQKIEQIKNEIKSLEKKDKVYLEQQFRLMKLINALKVCIPVIFDRIGCNNEEYLREMGDLIVNLLVFSLIQVFQSMNINDINEGNMLQFMGVIEKRTNEILQMYYEVFGNQSQQKEVGQESMERKKMDEQNAVEFQKILESFFLFIWQNSKLGVTTGDERAQEFKKQEELLNEAKSVFIFNFSLVKQQIGGKQSPRKK